MELYLLVCLLLLRVSVIHGVESIQDVTERLNDLNTSLEDVRGVVGNLEQRFDTDFNFAMSHMKSHVEHALKDILRTRSVDSLIDSQVMNALQRVEKEHRVLKNNFRFYVGRVSETERENRKMKAELGKVEHKLLDILHISTLQASEILNLKLKLNETRAMYSLAKQSDSGVTTVCNTVASSMRPFQYNMSRVLYVSEYYNTVPKQLSLKNNHLMTFSLQISNVRFYSVMFEPTSSKIIFSVGDKNDNLSICSSNLDGGAVKVIRYGIKSLGLAVDTTRNVIFMTTRTPTNTISRMRPDGSEFGLVADMKKYGNINTIAVAPDKQLIYSGHWYNVVETSYDGTVRRIIETGNRMYALDYDNISHRLYYINKYVLKRWSSIKGSVPIYNLTNYSSNFKVLSEYFIYQSCICQRVGHCIFEQGTSCVLEVRRRSELQRDVSV